MPKLCKKNFLTFLLSAFFSILLVAIPECVTAFSVSGNAVTFDVTDKSFSVVWEAEIDNPIVSYRLGVYNSDNTSDEV